MQAGFSHLASQYAPGQPAPGAMSAPELAPEPTIMSGAAHPGLSITAAPSPLTASEPLQSPPPPLIPEELLAADPDRAPGPQSVSLGWRLFRIFYIMVLLAAGAALVAWNML